MSSNTRFKLAVAGILAFETAFTKLIDEADRIEKEERV